jgi:formyl-CoA transferase
VGTVPNIGFAVKLQGPRSNPPLLGEHTEAILGELGVVGAAVDALRTGGAFEP